MKNFDIIEKFIKFSLGYSISLYKWSDWKGDHEDFVPDFIQEIEWSCNRPHIIDIWKEKVEDVVSPEGRMNLFWIMLDDYNQHQLVDYVINKYE